MRSIEYIPLKSPEGAVCGHARVRDGVIEVSMRRRMEGIAALVDGSGRLSPLGKRVRAEGTAAILWHENGLLRCFGFPRGSALNAEKLRLMLSAASDTRLPAAPQPLTPPQLQTLPPAKVQHAQNRGSEAPVPRGTLTERALSDASREARQIASARRAPSNTQPDDTTDEASFEARMARQIASARSDDGDEASFEALMARQTASARTDDGDEASFEALMARQTASARTDDGDEASFEARMARQTASARRAPSSTQPDDTTDEASFEALMARQTASARHAPSNARSDGDSDEASFEALMARQTASARRAPSNTQPDDTTDEASFEALMARADAVFRSLDTLAPPMRGDAPLPPRADTRRFQRVPTAPAAAQHDAAQHDAAQHDIAPNAHAPRETIPPEATLRKVAAGEVGSVSAPAPVPIAAPTEAPPMQNDTPAPPAGTRRFARVPMPETASDPVPLRRNDTETPAARHDEGEEWYRAVDALLTAPGKVQRAPVPVQNPFPHIFPDARFTMERGAEGELLSGRWRQGRDEMHVTAVRGEYSPQPPSHLPGFTRYIRTRQGGYWVRVEEPEEE